MEISSKQESSEFTNSFDRRLAKYSAYTDDHQAQPEGFAHRRYFVGGDKPWRPVVARRGWPRLALENPHDVLRALRGFDIRIG